MKMLTIFTPTYNRAYILPQLYESLCCQTNKDFEWIIVDDGSTDDTELLINDFISSKHIDIVYLKQPNGGKHRAINRAVKFARGEFFFIVDSDDYLPNDAVDVILKFLVQIEPNSKIAGICGLRSFHDGKIIAGEGIDSCIDDNSIKLRERYHIKGDMAEVFRTSIMREFPFPEFENENFISEAIVWNRIATQYVLRFIPVVIYITEYLPDGLTKSIRKRFRNSPKGTMLYFNEIIRSSLFGRVSKIIAAINYWRYTIGQSFCIRKSVFRPIWWSYFFIPLACFFSFLDRRSIH